MPESATGAGTVWPTLIKRACAPWHQRSGNLRGRSRTRPLTRRVSLFNSTPAITQGVAMLTYALIANLGLLLLFSNIKSELNNIIILQNE